MSSWGLTRQAGAALVFSILARMNRSISVLAQVGLASLVGGAKFPGGTKDHHCLSSGRISPFLRKDKDAFAEFPVKAELGKGAPAWIHSSKSAISLGDRGFSGGMDLRAPLPSD